MKSSRRAAVSSLPTDAEGWNLTRFDASQLDPKRGHLESTFLKLNEPASARALWVKLTIWAPTERASGGDPRQAGRSIGEAWAIAFDHTGPAARHVAVKHTTAIEAATLAHEKPYRLAVAGLEYDGRRVFGEIAHGDGRIVVDITLSPRDAAPFVPFPSAALYRLPFPKTKIVTPIFDADASGTVTIVDAAGTREWRVDRWRAMQGHNWGTAHADSYAWAHCNSWHEPEGSDVVLEGFSARVKLGGVIDSPLTTIIGVRVAGVRYEARVLADFVRARGSIEGLRRWSFSAEQAGASISGSISLRDDDVVGLYYPNPDGRMTYCLNSKLARATLRLQVHDRPTRVLTSDAAALEIATHDPHHGIRMYV